MNIRAEVKKMKRQGMTVITPTMRIECISQLINNYRRQKLEHKELIIIINNDAMNKKDFKLKWRLDPNIHIYQLPQVISLGECLNYAIERASYPYVAKFDDDDYYGENYLSEAYDTFKQVECDVVCKRTIAYYLDGYGELVIRLPITEKTYVKRGAGSTVCMKLDTFSKVRYSDINQGSDTDFFYKCNEKKLKIYSTSYYNYLCIRNRDEKYHTWQISADELKKTVRGYFTQPTSLEGACRLVNDYK